MPSIAERASPPDTSPTMKKRKREYAGLVEGNVAMKLGSAHFVGDHTPSHMSPHGQQYYSFENSDMTNASTTTSHERMLLKPRSMKFTRSSDHKRQRTTYSAPQDWHTQLPYPSHADTLYHTSQNSRHQTYSEVRSPSELTANRKPDLSACHICHKRPRVKADLDSYDDCQGCGRRTCYVCMRECLGTNADDTGMKDQNVDIGVGVDDVAMSYGIEASLMDSETEHRDESGNSSQGRWEGNTSRRHRRVVCSHCSKECGPDGDVRCHGCLEIEWGE